HRADDQAGQRPAPREDHGHVEPEGDAVAADDADDDAHQPAHLGEHDRFEQELADDVVLSRADGLAHADLAGPLGHADQHDVHDADAGGEQGDGADHERADADL